MTRIPRMIIGIALLVLLTIGLSTIITDLIHIWLPSVGCLR